MKRPFLLKFLTNQAKTATKKALEMLKLMNKISGFWNTIQQSLFPTLEDVLDTPFSKKLQQLIHVLDRVRIEYFVAAVLSSASMNDSQAAIPHSPKIYEK